METINFGVLINIAMPIICVLLGAGINHLIERRPKVICFLGHVSGIQLNLDNRSATVNTHSVVLRNTGRNPAKNVRLGHNILPNFQVYPDIEYQERKLPGGQTEIVFPLLIPRKEVIITYLYFPPLTWNQINTHIETDDGPIKRVTVLLTIQYPNWFKVILWGFFIYGFIAFVYTLWLLTSYLISLA